MKTIHLSRLQNAEHLALMTDFLTLLNEANIIALANLKTQLSEGVQKAEAAQMQIRKNEHTEGLVSLDEKRDKLYRGLVLRVQSEELSKLEEHQQAAKKVLLVINTYGNFVQHNYQKETTEIQNFVADLKSAEYLPSVKKIGLEEWVNWLEDANTAFSNRYTERRDEYAAQPVYDLKNIRKDLDILFKKIQETVEALEILQPSEEVATLTAKANASITKWKDILAQRQGKKSDKKEPEQPSETERSSQPIE